MNSEKAMSSRRRRVLGTLPVVFALGLLCLVGTGGQVAAQGDAPTDPAQDEGQSAQEGTGEGDAEGGGDAGDIGESGALGADAEGSGQSGDALEAPSVDDIDEMLRGEEEIFGAFETYAYDPGERRDPFRSLLIIREAPELQGPRPEGVPGLLIDEISLIGIVKTPKGYVAQVQAADRQKSFLLHEGEQLFDGEVLSIEGNEVVFKQIVRDPTAVKPFRERVKILNPS